MKSFKCEAKNTDFILSTENWCGIVFNEMVDEVRSKDPTIDVHQFGAGYWSALSAIAAHFDAAMKSDDPQRAFDQVLEDLREFQVAATGDVQLEN